MREIAVVGGGIIGLAIAYTLSKERFKVSLFEKESEIGSHQSGKNSGVLHCGLHYKPGSLKAHLAVRGIREMVSFCQKNHVDYEICGKVVAATNEKEEKLIEDLAERGKKNGLRDLKFLTKKELNKREPYLKANKALIVPEEGIVDYSSVMNKMAHLILQNGGSIYTQHKVLGSVINRNGRNTVICNNYEGDYDWIISCTGLHSDRNFKQLTKEQSPLKIIPFRGEYLRIKPEFENIVNHLIYPVPDPTYPFLGVHFTRLINKEREVGPNAVLALKREGYNPYSFSIKDSLDTITYPGFIKFLGQNFSFAVNEFKSSLTIGAFVKKAQKLIPDFHENMVDTAEEKASGVRAQAMSRNGELLMDFQVEKRNNQIHILNAPSPGATASLAIAKYILSVYLFEDENYKWKE